MSYIIAFVRYTDFTDKEYPVQCFRTDLKLNDIVLVRRTDGQLRFGTVLKLEYLNWDCKGFIICKKSECSPDDQGNLRPPSNSAIILGISTPEVFTKKLIDSGWVLLRPHSATYRKILTKTNESKIAYIFIRKNGIVMIERLWRSVKYEEVYLKAYSSVSDAKKQLNAYFEFYNLKRPHSSLDKQTPNEFYYDQLPQQNKVA